MRGRKDARLGLRHMRNNVVMLFGAFAIGQGVLFLAQSWLVFHGQLHFVGVFGTCFTFATLAFYLVDWGGMILLARYELAEGSEEGSAALFWNLTAARTAVAVLSIAAIVIWVNFHTAGFAPSYAMAAAPALLLAASNPGGILDGLQRSGITGLTVTFPTLITALLLPTAAFLPPEQSGLLLGAAFTAGTMLLLAAQFLVLKKLGKVLHFTRPRGAAVKAAARDGGVILLTMLPSYTFYRAQVAISALYLGPAATGLFVYAKQIVNAGMQAIYFIRRAEFPRLVAAVQDNAGIGQIVQVQRIAVGFGFFAALGLSVCGLFVGIFRRDDFGAAGLLIASFGPSIIAAAVYAALHQAYVARNRAGAAALAGNLLAVAGLLLSVPFVTELGAYGFAVAETVMNLASILAFVLLWRNLERSSNFQSGLHIGSYRVLQRQGNPVMALPANSRTARLNSIAQVNGFTPKRWALKQALRITVLLGADRLLMRAAKDPLRGRARIGIKELATAVQPSLTRPIASASIVWPWPPTLDRRRIYIQFFDKYGSPLAFTKMALHKDQTVQLVNEANMLADLGGLQSHQIHVPELVVSGNINGHQYITVEPLPLHVGPVGHKSSISPGLLDELAGPKQKLGLSELKSMPWWDAFEQAVAAVPGLTDKLMPLVRRKGLITSRIHGDFSAKNMLQAEGKLWVIDWEAGALRGPFLVDQISLYLSRPKRRAKSPAEMLRDLLSELGAGADGHLSVAAGLAYLQGVKSFDAALLLAHWQRTNIGIQA